MKNLVGRSKVGKSVQMQTVVCAEDRYHHHLHHHKKVHLWTVELVVWAGDRCAILLVCPVRAVLQPTVLSQQNLTKLCFSQM